MKQKEMTTQILGQKQAEAEKMFVPCKLKTVNNCNPLSKI